MKAYNYNRISEEEYKKAMSQFRMQLNAIWNSCRCHGLQELVAGNIEETMTAGEQLGMRLRGKDQPIMVRSRYSTRPTD